MILGRVGLSHRNGLPSAGKAGRLSYFARGSMNYAANLETIKKIVYFGYGTLPNSYMPIINYHWRRRGADSLRPRKGEATAG